MTRYLQWPLTFVAIVCLFLDRTIALAAFGVAGEVVLALVRVFLAPYSFVHYRLFRLSIEIWQPAAPAWWGPASVLLSLVPYVIADWLLRGTRADRAATRGKDRRANDLVG